MRYDYSCSICSGSVKKTPTGKKKGKEDEWNGLHGWSCSSCGHGVKVSRKLK